METAMQTAFTAEEPAISTTRSRSRNMVLVSLDLFARLRRGELPSVRSSRERPARGRKAAAVPGPLLPAN